MTEQKPEVETVTMERQIKQYTAAEFRDALGLDADPLAVYMLHGSIEVVVASVETPAV
jgi:hypothetical protein